MVQSLNTKIDFTTKATAFTPVSEYGDIIIGDKAFEFYHHSNNLKYIQIPWQEVEHVTALVIAKGKWIPRYSIHTKQNGTFTFASKQPKKVLQAIRPYIGSTKMSRSLGFFSVIKRAFCKRRKTN